MSDSQPSRPSSSILDRVPLSEPTKLSLQRAAWVTFGALLGSGAVVLVVRAVGK